MHKHIPRRIRMPVVLVGALAGAAVAVFAGALPAGAAPDTDLPPGVGVVHTNGGWLRVRVGPSTDQTQVGTLAKGAQVTIVCQAVGELVEGRVRTTDRWDRLSDGQFISDAYVRRDVSGAPPVDCAAVAGEASSSTASSSSSDSSADLPAPATTVRWTVPVDAPVGSGFRTKARPNHNGVDLPAGKGTPIRAAAAGKVIRVTCNSDSSCDTDGSLNTSGCGWMLEIRHAGDVVTRYCHLVRRPSVSAGDTVAVGEVVGFVGTSGHSSGPHLHFEVHLGTVANSANAVDPVPFMREHGAPFAQRG